MGSVAKPKLESAALILYPVLLLVGMFAAVAVGTGCIADPGFPAGAPPSNQAPPVGGGDQEAGGCDEQAVVNTVFTQRCTGGACHSAGNKAGGLDLASPGVQERLIGALSSTCGDKVLVSAGNASGSYLLDKLQGAGDICGTPMPKGGPSLDAAKINCVADWIDSMGNGNGNGSGSGSGSGGGGGGDGELPPGGW